MELHELLQGNVLALTGAGLSAASGLPTFRGAGGLYEGRNAYELASPEGFSADPALVWNWYLMRIRKGLECNPNDGHYALAELERKARRMTLISSNVDNFHELAGSKNLYKLHGSIMHTRCLSCESVEDVLVKKMPEVCTAELLPRCSCGGLLRPNVVWFGEYPNTDAISAFQESISDTDVMLEIGVSGQVTYGFTEFAVQQGVPVIRINPDESLAQPGVHLIAESADVALRQLVNQGN